MQVDHSIASRWTPTLARKFCPVSSVFLEHYAELGLSPAEAMLIIQLVDHKWTSAAPFPSLATLSERLRRTTRQVRSMLSRLEGAGLLRRVGRGGRSNAYDLQPLFDRLEQMAGNEPAAQTTATAAPALPDPPATLVPGPVAVALSHGPFGVTSVPYDSPRTGSVNVLTSTSYRPPLLISVNGVVTTSGGAQ